MPQPGRKSQLISGPVQLEPPDRVSVHPVTSAAEMCAAALSLAEGADLFIGAAAVADYRPESPASTKLKKQSGGPLTLTLVENPDIIAQVTQLPTVLPSSPGSRLRRRRCSSTPVKKECAKVSI